MQKKQALQLALVTGISATILMGCTTLPMKSSSAAPAPSAISHTYDSPYMNAADTPLTALENGALVCPETLSYWELDENDPKRASYDRDAVIEVAEGVWTLASPSIANSHVIQAPEGLIVYDTGDNLKEGAHFYKMIRSVSDLPIRAIIYSHEHYVAGAKSIVDSEAARGNKDIMIIGHPNTNTEMARTGGVSAVHPEVANVLFARSIEQFNFYLPDEGPDARFKNTIIPGEVGDFVAVNTPVEDGQTLNIAGLEVTFFTESIATDTNNQVLAWIPSRGISMDNITWGWFPNIYSARGGRYRNPQGWIAAIDKIRELAPKVLLGVHCSSLNDPDAIQERLLAYRDGLSFVLDQSLKGMLLGEGPDELAYSVRLPKHLAESPILVQNYGEVSVMAPRIFTAIFGQFDRNAVTMNKLHPQEEAERMVAAMGGADAVAKLVETAHKEGNYLWAAQLGDYLVKTDPASKKFRNLKAAALRQMAYRAVSTNTRSWYLTQALALEGKTAIVKTLPAFSSAVSVNLRDYVDFYRVRINPEAAAQTDKVIQLVFDPETAYLLHIRHSVVQFVETPKDYDRTPDVTIAVTPEVWTEVFNNTKDPADLIDQDKLRVTDGDPQMAKDLFAMFDPIFDWTTDPALKAWAKTAGQKK